METKKTRDELLDKLVRLENDRKDIKGQKKASAREYGDQLKEIDTQINSILLDLEGAKKA